MACESRAIPPTRVGSNVQEMMYFETLEEVDANAEALLDVIEAYVVDRS